MQREFHSGVATRPLSALLRLSMMGFPALRARRELAASACAPVLGRDRGGSSSAGARAWHKLGEDQILHYSCSTEFQHTQKESHAGMARGGKIDGDPWGILVQRNAECAVRWSLCSARDLIKSVISFSRQLPVRESY